MAYCHEHWPRDMLWFHFHKLIQHWCVYSQTDIKTIDRNVWEQKPKDVSPMFRDIHAVDFLEIVSIHYKKHSLSSIQVHLNKNKDYRHKCTRCNWSPAFAGESKPSLVLQSWVPKSEWHRLRRSIFIPLRQIFKTQIHCPFLSYISIIHSIP